MLTRALSTSIACACVSLVCALMCVDARAQGDAALQYQSRGDRSEGLRTIPVGGYDVELLSAAVEPADSPTAGSPSAWSEAVRLRFFLPADDKAFITVRQLRSRTTYYWLNNVNTTLKPRAINEYTWPTDPVLRRLPNVRLLDLGVIVRLDQEQPAKSERVVPALLYDAKPSDVAAAYRFAMKTNGRANVSAAIYSGDKELYKRPANWEDANSPFTVRWDAGSLPEGWYRLVLTGYFTNNTKLDKEIRFYHRPSLSDSAAAPRRQ
jgi:hypothetical protein